MESIHGSSQSVVLDNSGDAETIVSATVTYEASMADADRLTNFDEGDEDEAHDNQDDDYGHDEDESISANFGSEVDPVDEGLVADATNVGEDVCDPTHEKGSEAKDRTEDGRSED
ncbi:hypothetical protein PsorP6_006143 [Peronosclerospora sorghi]|uniref:Uncharacterized protein n=1 Tax=Peronosclerospora sorghi TaxID=230839 RepID=A0ACC0W1K3_9STRA|nr:hypothetical protein PsorP6_006143 [Peronosclerospora sorghi]